MQINAAYKASVGPQLLGSSDVKTYPCDGATGINRRLYLHDGKLSLPL